MTTPQYPWGTTDPADLPQGVITPSQLGTALQDQSQAKYTELAASKFPDIAKTTSAGSPSLVSAPIGIITNKLTQIVSNVANADPATITSPKDIVNRSGNLFHGLPLLSLLGDIAGAISGAVGGGINTIKTFFDDLLGGALQGINPFSVFSRIGDIFFHQAAVSNTASSASVTADAAIAAATAANNSVLSLINGGRRTIYTTSFTYVKPANLVKLGIVPIGGAGAGLAGVNVAGGIGGGYLYYEIPASAVPDSVACTIGAGRPAPSSASGNQTPTTTSFGSIISSLTTGYGTTIVGPSPVDANGAAARMGGSSGVNTSAAATNYGYSGDSSLLAPGGAGGSYPSNDGKPGANASTTQQFLATGGAGGGGVTNTSFGGYAGNGGAGGFPGGPGGAAGRGPSGNWTPGPGAPGMLVLIEFTS